MLCKVLILFLEPCVLPLSLFSALFYSACPCKVMLPNGASEETQPSKAAGRAELPATVFHMFLSMGAWLDLNLRRKQNGNFMERQVSPPGIWSSQNLLFSFCLVLARFCPGGWCVCVSERQHVHPLLCLSLQKRLLVLSLNLQPFRRTFSHFLFCFFFSFCFKLVHID